MQFPAQLKRIRQAKGVTQKQVADALGVSKQTITAYEAGTREPDLMKLIALAEVLDSTPDELLGRKKAPAQNEQELTEVDLQIINLLPFVPEKVKAGVVQILAATVDLAAAQESSGQYIQEARAHAAQAYSDDMQQQQRG